MSLQQIIDSGIIETVLISTMLSLLVSIELLSGSNIPIVKRIRRGAQWTTLPVGLMFAIIMIIRASNLI